MLCNLRRAGASLLWGICSLLDSGLLATAVKVSKSCHNSTIKLLIQNPSISFQDNTAISLHCKFQALIFSDHGENANSYLAEWLTHTHKRWLPYASGLRPPRHNHCITRVSSKNTGQMYHHCCSVGKTCMQSRVHDQEYATPYRHAALPSDSVKYVIHYTSLISYHGWWI